MLLNEGFDAGDRNCSKVTRSAALLAAQAVEVWVQSASCILDNLYPEVIAAVPAVDRVLEVVRMLLRFLAGAYPPFSHFSHPFP